MFPPCRTATIPEFPAFITAISSNHFNDGLVMLDHFNLTIRRKYPNVELYIFDIGLSQEEALEVSFLSRNKPCFPYNVAVPNFLVSHTCNIRFHDGIDRTVRVFTS